jgi:hypothetical protein
MDRQGSDNGQDLYESAREQSPGDGPQRPEQDHRVQDAHGGSMAPGLVDDTGHLVGGPPAGSPDN